MSHLFPDRTKVALLTVAVLALSGVLASSASAFHKWGDYHWGKTESGTFPSQLKLGDNVSGSWDTMLRSTSSDWSVDPYSGTNWLSETDSDGNVLTSASNPVRTAVVAGSTSPKRCAAKSGRVEVCNERYGRNGWLGVASIWASGSHITQATAKMNDTYLNSSAYAAYRMPVMCQEVGHAFGLGHQGENEVDWHTCMDYSAPHAEHSNAPNFHDYNDLSGIYGHADTSTTMDTSTATLATKRGSVPQRTERHDHGSESTIVEHYADNSRKITHIRWVPGSERGRPDHQH